MEDDEKRWNRIMAVICFLIMIGIMAFMVQKNQRTEKENIISSSPTAVVTAEPMD